jgi:hypothetical protein
MVVERFEEVYSIRPLSLQGDDGNLVDKERDRVFCINGPRLLEAVCMSSLPIPRQKKVSDNQFVGDLTNLFARHRIECGESGSLEHFYSRLVSNDAFRSQLFTLCTAISHMSETDLSGEQLLELIARALGVPKVAGVAVQVPESVASEFLSGYTAWSNRDLYEPQSWPPVRASAPTNEPLPFPQPADGVSLDTPPEVHSPGRRMQEALGLARERSPIEDLPPREVSSVGANVENLTISELTKLLEDIDRRMSRIKPHMQELTSLIKPEAAPVERFTKPHDLVGVHSSRVTAPKVELGPSLVVPSGANSVRAIESAAETSEDSVEDSFLARHAYLKPKRRLPPGFESAPLITIPPPAPPVLAAIPVIAPLEASKAAAVAQASEVAPAFWSGAEFWSSPALRGERSRVYLHVMVGILAALVLVGSPLVGVLVYRSIHLSEPRYVYEYQAPAQPTVDATASAANQNPAGQSATGGGGKPNQTGAPASTGMASHAARSTRATKKTPPVAVWPPPPSH